MTASPRRRRLATLWRAPSGAKRWLGAQPPALVTWALALVFCAWVLIDVLLLGFSTGVSRATFDKMVRYRLSADAPDARMVIVDIDEASLAKMGKEFGRWPWPRDTLATVLDHIESQKPAAVVWDISFADADRISPGGDAAFNAAAAKSANSHFPVIRLPAANDVHSQITRTQLPRLWLPDDQVVATQTSTVALIAPALAEVARSRLGTNNATPDVDGVVRRFRLAERLADGSRLASVPISVSMALNPAQAAGLNESATASRLIVWRKSAGLYPKVSFADVFSQAERATPQSIDFKGKIAVIGSTAPSLHDIHPTPLSPTMAGVESLTTVIDNSVNSRELSELSRFAQALVAIGLCFALAAWVQWRGITSLAPALLGLPVALLVLTFASLHGPLFVDLNLSAGIGLVFLALLRVFDGFRMDHWLSVQAVPESAMVVSARSREPLTDADLSRVMDVLAKRAKHTRIMCAESQATWPAQVRWPAAGACLSLIGPAKEIDAACAWLPRILKFEDVCPPCVAPLSQGGDLGIDPQGLAATVFGQWAALMAQTPKP